MPAELISTLIVGALAALFTWLGFRALRRPLPRRVLPLVTGGAMLAFAVWSDYAWWWRTRAALPSGIEVIDTLPGRTLWRPWTFIYPSIGRMVAVDRAGVRTNPEHPDVRLVDVVLLERWMPAKRAPRLVDCAAARIANADDPAAFAADGLPAVEAWSPMRRESPLYAALCASAAAPSGSR
jgi:hypothetical protein